MRIGACVVLAMLTVPVVVGAQDGPIMRSAMRAASVQSVVPEKPSASGKGYKIAGGILVGLGAYYFVSAMMAHDMDRLSLSEQETRQKQWMTLGFVCSGIGTGLLIKGRNVGASASVSPKGVAVRGVVSWKR